MPSGEQVYVRVVEAGNNAAAMEIEDLSARAGKFSISASRTDCEDMLFSGLRKLRLGCRGFLCPDFGRERHKSTCAARGRTEALEER